jgi:hypothetical protein
LRLKYKDFSLTALLMIVSARMAQLKSLHEKKCYNIDLTTDLWHSLVKEKSLQPYFTPFYTKTEIEAGLYGFFDLSEFNLPRRVTVSCFAKGEKMCRMGYITDKINVYLYIGKVK